MLKSANQAPRNEKHWSKFNGGMLIYGDAKYNSFCRKQLTAAEEIHIVVQSQRRQPNTIIITIVDVTRTCHFHKMSGHSDMLLDLEACTRRGKRNMLTLFLETYGKDPKKRDCISK